jgi:anaerobic carbon-monoxide dehydrogenase iron sulfur subunit
MASNGATPAADGGPTRRTVLKGATAAVGAFIALEAIGGVTLAAGAAPKTTPIANGVIYPDPALCIGCLTCEVICSRVHKEAGMSDIPRIRIFNDANVKVDPEVLAAYPGRGSFHQEPCLQCPTAECLYVCPVNALRVEPTTGARIIREDVCVSCNRCAEACPFPVSGEQNATNQLKIGQQSRISYDAEKDTFSKCDLCYWRDGNQTGLSGSGPACVQQCPVNIRIKQGILKSDRMCLDAPASNRETWNKLRAFQTFEGSPAQNKA